MVGLWDLPVAFYFGVTFPMLPELAFKEVSGLNVEMEIETVSEGGVNEFQYQLPRKVKHGNLILKRALEPLTDAVTAWLTMSVENAFNGVIVPTPIVLISLKNELGIPIRVWACTHAYPVKWGSEPLDAEKNSVLIETIELAYRELRRIL